MPALLKGFLEQLFRPSFVRTLKGRSARVVVTMGMPSLVYRWFFRAHGVKNLRRNILKFCGFGPVRESLIGMVEGKPSSREAWLKRMEELGRQGT
jgi:putative NADPH-quinone reductase